MPVVRPVEVYMHL